MSIKELAEHYRLDPSKVQTMECSVCHGPLLKLNEWTDLVNPNGKGWIHWECWR